MSSAPNEWDLARGLDTLSLNIGRHPGGFLVVFLVTSYSSVSPSVPHALHNSLPFNASSHIWGMKSPQTRQGCNTKRDFVSGCFSSCGTFPQEIIACVANDLCPEKAVPPKDWKRSFKGVHWYKWVQSISGLWIGTLMDPKLCKIGMRRCVLVTISAVT